MTTEPAAQDKDLDQFFTRWSVAHRCWDFYRDQVAPYPDAWYVEPSVGSGSFYDLLPANRRHGYEIDPQFCKGDIQQADFLAFTPITFRDQPGFQMHMVGNPPFGKRGKTARAFIEQCFALGADYVGFIVPKSVTKRSFKNCHLVASMNIDDGAFVHPWGQTAGVSGCAFGIWKKGPPPVQEADRGRALRRLARVHYIEMTSKRKSGQDKVARCQMFVFAAFYASGEYGVRKKPWPGVNFGVEVVDEQDVDRVYRYLRSLDWRLIATQAMRGNYTIKSVDVKNILQNYLVQPRPSAKTCDEYVELYSIGFANKKAGRCEWGMSKLDQCDLFLPNARRHAQAMRASTTKDYPIVIGVKLKKQKAALRKFIEGFDWGSVAHKSTNRNQCLNQAIVREAIINAGFVDGAPAGAPSAPSSPVFERPRPGRRPKQ